MCVRTPSRLWIRASKYTFRPVHKFLILIAYAQNLSLNADTANVNRELINFGLSLYLDPCLVYVSSEGSGESAHMRIFALAFVARQCNVIQSHMLAHNFDLKCGWHCRKVAFRENRTFLYISFEELDRFKIMLIVLSYQNL